MEQFNGFYPAKILSIANDRKTVQVSVEPYTNGLENGITAKLAYPVGFDDKDTELQIVGQPDVWVFFERGQFKNPVVSFFRTRQTGSVTGVFRLRHKKLEFYADNIDFYAKNIKFDADTHTTGKATSDGDMVANGISVGEHNHGNVRNGEGVTSKPIGSSGGSSGGGSSSDGTEQNGQSGAAGPQGEQGPPGRNGLSAFQIASMEGFTGTPTEWLDSLKGDDAVIDFHNQDGMIHTGRLKVWQGIVNANNTWSCDYSSAGFTQKPMLWANGLPIEGMPILAIVDSENATKDTCTGYAFSIALNTETGKLNTPGCSVKVYAMGI